MLTIVWDVDDVLNDLMYQWFTFGWLPENPHCKISYHGLKENPPDAVLSIPRETYLCSIDAFRKTDRAINMEPNAEVLAWMREHGHLFRHVALTARPLETAPDVAYWVMRHFGAWVRSVGVVPTRTAPDVPAYDSTKGDFLKWVRCGDIVVDDSAENARQSEDLGLKALLYPRPWNASPLTVTTLLKKLTDLAVSF
jgi:hypothetical protein